MDLQTLFDLHNKTVVITGGAGYLGSAMSEVLVANGAKLYIMGKDHKKNKDFADKLRKKYGLARCESVTFDIDSKESIETAVNDIIKKEKFIFTSELALAISNGLQIEEGLKMLVGF